MRQFIVLLLLGSSAHLFAQDTTESKTHFNLEKGLALQGYDPVAYFSDKASKGEKKYSTIYQGVEYYFSSENNRDTFLQNPSKYEPQYGGWCAFAMGDCGKKVEINPETFKIVEGKLYLFYDAYFNSTLKSWNKNEKNLKTKADINWLTILNTKWK